MKYVNGRPIPSRPGELNSQEPMDKLADLLTECANAFSATVDGDTFALTALGVAGTSTFTLGATDTLTIDAGTTDHTGSTIITMDMDVNSASCSGIKIDLDIGTALSTSENTYAFHADVAGVSGDNGNASIAAFYGTGDTTSGAPVYGLQLAGAWDTAIYVSGTSTTAVSIAGNATTAIGVATGTFTTGLSLGGTLTTGVSIGACTTAVAVTGATTQAIYVTGNSTTAFMTNTGTFTNGISLAGTLTYGMRISACTTGISFDGSMTTGIAIPGSVATAISLSGSVADGIAIFSSGSPMALSTYANYAMKIYTTCASTDASNSVEPFYMKSSMTGVGGVGGRARFHLYTNVALGGWSNALKAFAEYGASGRTTGLGSAFCAEMTLSAGTSSGTYAPLEIELNVGSGASTGTNTAFIHCSVQGADVATFDTNGLLFNIQGVTAADGKFVLLDGDEPTWNENTVYLKSLVGSTSIYLIGCKAAAKNVD